MRKQVLIAALAAIWGATAAHAHIVFSETEAQAGAYYAGFLRVSHGCEGSPTTALRVEIPEGIFTAKPQPKPGWTLEVEREALADPVETEGQAVTERVTAITWRGELPDEQFDQFGLMLKLPATEGPLYFSTVQTCATGSRSWTQTPAEGQAWGSVPSPAPVVRVSAPAEAQSGASAGHDAHQH